MTKTPLCHKARSFRPWPENQREFEFAEKLQFNVSELLNEIVARHFRRHVKLKANAISRLSRVAKLKPGARR